MSSKFFTVAFILGTVFYISTSAQNAEDCGPGYFLPSSGLECEKCPAGTYQPESGATDCIPCPEGYINSNSGAISCEACGEQETSDASRTACQCVHGYGYNYKSESCKICKPGYRFMENGRWTHCSKCTAGTYQPEKGATTCLECPSGTKSGVGASQCLRCAEGETVIGKACGKCKRGKYFHEYSSSCKKCYYGSYMPFENTFSGCLQCPPNSYSGRGYSACITCKEKTALMRSGKCASCRPGQFYDMYSQKCYGCPRNTFTPSRDVFPSCFDCGFSSFSFFGSDKCTHCKLGTTLLIDGKCGKCRAGTHLHRDLGHICVTCPVNTYSYEGIMEYCDNCPDGSYARPGSSSCFFCPHEQAFMISDNECGVCPPGKTYYTPDAKCVRCYPGTYKPETGNDSCKTCPKGYVPNRDRIACEKKDN